MRDTMEAGCFYFLTNEYFDDFKDPNLMNNHEAETDANHDRPCFYAFFDTSTGLYWMIPLSSHVSKYQEVYQKKVSRFGKCDTILFGEILGHTKAFLIQNMCPVIPKYINNEYIDRKTCAPVRVDGRFEAQLVSKAKKVLALQRKGFRLIFPDVLEIEKQLLSGMN